VGAPRAVMRKYTWGNGDPDAKGRYVTGYAIHPGSEFGQKFNSLLRTG